MSAGYASRLKEYPNKGVCGLPENYDTTRAFERKVKELALWILEANGRVVIVTGAGISTTAGIPDFRGPKGIWTVEKLKKAEERKNKKRREQAEKLQKQHDNNAANDGATKNPLKKLKTNGLNHSSLSEPREEIKMFSRTSPSPKTTAAVVEETEVKEKPLMDFARARPTLTHCAITCLINSGLVDFCVTQNVDGLHQRSGLSRDKLAVLHGCVFTEICESCDLEHFRDADVGTISFQRTGRHCSSCGGYLKDTLLDWEDELPEYDFDRSDTVCAAANVVICLGTSLRIEPAGSLPFANPKSKVVICNLQETAKDDEAAMIIRAKTDKIMSKLMEMIGGPAGWDEKNVMMEDVKIERRWQRPKEYSPEQEDQIQEDAPKTENIAGAVASAKPPPTNQDIDSMNQKFIGRVH